MVYNLKELLSSIFVQIYNEVHTRSKPPLTSSICANGGFTLVGLLLFFTFVIYVLQNQNGQNRKYCDKNN